MATEKFSIEVKRITRDLEHYRICNNEVEFNAPSEIHDGTTCLLISDTRTGKVIGNVLIPTSVEDITVNFLYTKHI